MDKSNLNFGGITNFIDLPNKKLKIEFENEISEIMTVNANQLILTITDKNYICFTLKNGKKIKLFIE